MWRSNFSSLVLKFKSLYFWIPFPKNACPNFIYDSQAPSSNWKFHHPIEHYCFVFFNRSQATFHIVMNEPISPSKGDHIWFEVTQALTNSFIAQQWEPWDFQSLHLVWGTTVQILVFLFLKSPEDLWYLWFHN